MLRLIPFGFGTYHSFILNDPCYKMQNFNVKCTWTTVTTSISNQVGKFAYYRRAL